MRRTTTRASAVGLARESSPPLPVSASTPLPPLPPFRLWLWCVPVLLEYIIIEHVLMKDHRQASRMFTSPWSWSWQSIHGNIQVFLLNRADYSESVLRLVFIFPIMFYAMYYRYGRKSALSCVYRHDKYGIVILYLCIQALSLIHQLDMLYKYVNSSGTLAESSYFTLRGRFLSLMVIIKIIWFNLIFKHHTGRNPVHSNTHLFYTFSLAAIVVISFMTTVFFEAEYKKRFGDFSTIETCRRIIYPLGAVIGYLYFDSKATHIKQQRKPDRGTKTNPQQVLSYAELRYNFLTALSEAILIVYTF